MCSHFDSAFCQLTTTTKYTNHFHVLIDTSEAATSYDDIFKRNKAFPVSCLFTSFRCLFSSATDLETKGDVFFKLKIAVDFNIKNEEGPEFATTEAPTNKCYVIIRTATAPDQTTGKNCQVSEDNGGAEVIAQHDFAGRKNSN